jgi:hypothetical protein
MILKRVILRWIKHLEKRRRRVTAPVSTKLVNLIKKE